MTTEARKRWKRDNPDKVKEQYDRWARKHPDYRRPGDYPARRKARRLKHLYGVTLEQVNAMSIDQANRCPICLRTVPLVIDHDHETGRIRGLLCRPCNAGLGLLGDQDTRVQLALDYLRK